MKTVWCLTDYVLQRKTECYETYWISHLSHKENGSTRENIRILHIVTPTYIHTYMVALFVHRESFRNYSGLNMGFYVRKTLSMLQGNVPKI